MNIRIAGKSDTERWDEYVCSHPYGTPYHLTAWTNAVHYAYGFEIRNFIADDSGGIKGVFPVIKIVNPFGKSIFCAVPYGDIGGILANDAEVERVLLEAVYNQSIKEGARGLELRGDLLPQTLEDCRWLTQQPLNKVRMLLDLPGSSTILWESFKSKLRSQIRKAEKNGLIFSFDNNGLSHFYNVLSRNMRDLGSPVHSLKWYASIMQEYGDNARIALVALEKKVVAGALIIRAANRISIPWASTIREYNHLNPNMLLYWGILKHTSDTGGVLFDFGRSTPQEGTYRFKAQWGAKPIQLNWYSTVVADGGRCNDGSVVPKVRGYIETFWKRLPVRAAVIFGSAIRKYITL